ncbi:annexin D4-like [Malania oleifera]|uniref:annexin D4-like n=1 Tax=Malania oleifera TaxID=397392 RepID=UPI0025AE8EFD|nr:annexin D4-like [Malania oleifera]
MALSDHSQLLSKAFSGLGVDEMSLISTLGEWNPERRRSFRKEGTPRFFIEDDRFFERWNEQHIAFLKCEFTRFQNAVVLWTMHPWERDARLLKEALRKVGPLAYSVIIEVACTRSSEELLGARRAYHALFDRSIEEDVAHHVNGSERKMLVALVSSYRYEGPKVSEEAAKCEAKTLCSCIRNADKKQPMEDEEVVRIVATRSKPHLRAIYKHYEGICGSNLDEDLNVDLSLKDMIQCLCTPQIYFCKALDAALRNGGDENTKEALTRVIATQADAQMKEIKEQYHNQYGVSLSEKIEERANGNYKEFLLTLLTRDN